MSCYRPRSAGAVYSACPVGVDSKEPESVYHLALGVLPLKAARQHRRIIALWHKWCGAALLDPTLRAQCDQLPARIARTPAQINRQQGCAFLKPLTLSLQH